MCDERTRTKLTLLLHTAVRRVADTAVSACRLRNERSPSSGFPHSDGSELNATRLTAGVLPSPLYPRPKFLLPREGRNQGVGRMNFLSLPRPGPPVARTMGLGPPRLDASGVKKCDLPSGIVAPGSANWTPTPPIFGSIAFPFLFLTHSATTRAPVVCVSCPVYPRKRAR